MAAYPGVSQDLLIEFMLEDLQQTSAATTGSSLQFEDDKKLAAKLFQDELQHGINLKRDRLLSANLETASQRDEEAIRQSLALETRERQDRDHALNIGGQAAQPARGEAAHQHRHLPDRRVNAATAPRTNDDFTIMSLPLAYAESEAGIDISKSEFVQIDACIACAEERPTIFMLKSKCGHLYCAACVPVLFKQAMKDEQWFPPRCCKQPIPKLEAKRFLGEDLSARFDEKALEFTTPNRTYCANQDCSAFIRPDSIVANAGRCRKCRSATCALCKKPAHTGTACRTDAAEQALKETARAEGWQTCSNCRRVVEIAHGCNHMTCRCKYEFCYVCAAKWKTCNCQLWDEQRLLEAGQRRAARNQAQNNAAPANGGVAVQQAVQHVQQHHACQHRVWDHHQLADDYDDLLECETCGFEMDEYYYDCRHCGQIACNRCRLNHTR